MNSTIRHTATAIVLAAALTGMSTSASADEGVASRLAATVGHAIAQQGNAALATIKEEIKAKLADTLLPQRAETEGKKAQVRKVEAEAAEQPAGLAV